MSDKAIEVRGLSKDYHIYTSPRDRLLQLLTGRNKSIKVRALDGVTFSVARGEVVGILGRNGAGKSTLLKVLTHVLPASAGSVEVRGKISAILELGVGINPEYSGRDNAILGSLARGVDPKQLGKIVTKIIDFSELSDVIDRPLKSYSSGMQARLLFSTAIMVDADVMIIDEALAAGDALFQEKCLNKMRSIAESGVTVLFVSHSIDLVQQLCTRAILMHKGQIICDGRTADVTQEYYARLAAERNNAVKSRIVAAPSTGIDIDTHEQIAASSDITKHRAKDIDHLKSILDAAQPMKRDSEKCPFIERAVIARGDGTLVSGNVEHGEELSIAMRVCSPSRICRLIVGFEIRLPTGFTVYSVQNVLLRTDIRFVDCCDLSWMFKCTLQNGPHIIGIGVGSIVDHESDIRTAPFEITDLRQQWSTINVSCSPEFGGIVNLQPHLKW
jgi:ABC-type polysaccharide/polyol phosphate transport system ATPase subunit